MQELHKMVEQLREKLESKKKSMSDTTNNHSLVQRRQRAIELFEKSILEVETHPFHKKEVILNYEKEFKEIMEDISQIKDSTN